jgi:hypothetical protein
MTKLDIVEYFSIADQDDRSVLAEYGLHAIFQPYDTEPAKPESHVVKKQGILGIRSSMNEFAVHSSDDDAGVLPHLPVIGYEAANTAHMDICLKLRLRTIACCR